MILEALLDGLSVDAPVRDVRIGPFWTAVQSSACGLAATASMLGSAAYAHERPIHQVGSLTTATALELAQLALSRHPLEASVGVAALNSLLASEPRDLLALDAGHFLLEAARGRRVALVGHFPFVPKLRAAAAELWVLEMQPRPGDLPAGEAGKVLPQAEVVGITGAALATGAMDHLLEACRPDAIVVILGPSSPLSPVLFRFGVDLIGGVLVTDETATIRCVAEGAVFSQLQGLRKVTLVRPGLNVDQVRLARV